MYAAYFVIKGFAMIAVGVYEADEGVVWAGAGSIIVAAPLFAWLESLKG